MHRFVALSLWAGLCLAQAPADSSNQPPAAVDEALRARITQFFQYHVDGKFRQAEALIAEDSKDYFYSANKPRYLNFEIKSVEYSEEFTRAKALVLCEMYVVVPGFAEKPLKVPIGGTWKLVDGQWYWYVDPESVRMTPMGKSVAPTNPSSGAPSAAPVIPTADQMKSIFTMVKADKEVVTLKVGDSEQVTITNTAPGPMSISLLGSLHGVDVKLDHMDLKAGEKSVLSLRARDGAKPGTLSIQVEQTNQVIPIRVNIE